jgi:ketosteroid isomerase-like protein
MQLSREYQSIINSLDYINRGDARELTVLWVSDFKARITQEDTTIHSIVVDRPELLDHAVADYLVLFAERLAKVRFRQAMVHADYTH